MSPKRSLRVLHVVPTYYPAVRYGGTLPAVHGLASGLARRGHDVHVYTTTMDGPGDLDVPTAVPVSLDGVQVHYFRVPALRRLAWSPSMFASLRTTVRTFDIVHLHSVYLLPTAFAAYFSRRERVPYVVSPHGMLVGDIIRRKSRWIKSAWIALVERHSLAGASGIHVSTELEAREARALGLGMPTVLRIANGLDVPETYEPFARGPYADLPRPFVLFLSRISWKKGLDRLIRAWRRVPGLTLVIAGNDDEGFIPKLRSMPDFASVSDRIRFIGPVSDADKWALYREAVLFILPSYSENFGYVVAEAMAVGCPVIVTPEVGLAAFVRDSGAGLVVPGDPERLADAMSSLISQPLTREHMGKCGSQAVHRDLSRSGVAREMEEAYLGICAGIEDAHPGFASSGTGA